MTKEQLHKYLHLYGVYLTICNKSITSPQISYEQSRFGDLLRICIQFCRQILIHFIPDHPYKDITLFSLPF